MIRTNRSRWQTCGGLLGRRPVRWGFTWMIFSLRRTLVAVVPLGRFSAVRRKLRTTAARMWCGGSPRLTIRLLDTCTTQSP
jgi:hypothetical protein